MTYIGPQAMLTIAARRLSAPQPFTFGTWVVTWQLFELLNGTDGNRNPK